MELPDVKSSDDLICLVHIENTHLKRRVSTSLTVGQCAVCALATTEGVAVDELALIVHDQAENSYSREPPFPYVEDISAIEVVETLLGDEVDSDFSTAVCALVSDLFYNDFWFQEVGYETNIETLWFEFEHRVKHETRLLTRPESGRPETPPEWNFDYIENLLSYTSEEVGLVRDYPEGTQLYRARTARSSFDLRQTIVGNAAKQLGTPPAELASAGRMNAQGIPLLYVARDAETACAEVVSHSQYTDPVVGMFTTTRGLKILDLTFKPPKIDRYDDDPPKEEWWYSGLSFFVKQITRPVILDDQHPIDYAPTQLITEALRWHSQQPIDGIAYPSEVNPGGTNLVLFFNENHDFANATAGSKTIRVDRLGLPHDPVFTIDHTTVRIVQMKREIKAKRSPFF